MRFYYWMLALCVSACGKPQLECTPENVTEPYRAQIAAQLNQDLAHKIGDRYASLIDSHVIMEAFNQAKLQFMPDHANKEQCTGLMTLTFDADTWMRAQRYFPLLGSHQIYAQQFSNALNAEQIAFKDNSLQWNALLGMQSDHAVVGDEASVRRVSRVIAETLLAYGTRQDLIIEGKNYTREEALAQLNRSPLWTENLPRIDSVVAQDQNNNLPNGTENTETLSHNATLEAARAAYEVSYQNWLNQWDKLDASVKESLVDDEGQWTQNLPKRCVQEDEIARLSCQVRLIDERVRYLKGFSIE